MNLADHKEVSFSSSLIPVGRVEMCTIQFDPEKKIDKNGNGYYSATLEVVDGKYSGSKCYDNIVVDGPDGYRLQRGKTVLMYILECSHQAHKNPQFYNFNSVSELNGGKVLVKFDVKPHITKNGKPMLINEVDSYATPRETSSTNKYYVAWAKGDQLWETDVLPPLPRVAASQSNGLMSERHPYDDSSIPL